MERAVLTVEEGRAGADITCGGGNIAPFPTLSLPQQAEETIILPGHRTRILVVLFVAIAIVAGCGRRRSSRSGPARQLKKSEMSVAEQKYGIAPIPDPSVTYQPDVIIVGGGADAVRAQSSNGFIWTIDGHAPHAAELVPGKIFFLTGRAVGRVLDVRKDGGNLVIVVGPVNLTDVIREADIKIDMPIDFGEAIAYSSPDFPGRVVSLARASTGDDAAVRPVAFVTEPGSVGDSQAAAPVPDVSKLLNDNFTVSPVVSTSEVGLRVSSDAAAMKVLAQVTVHLAEPRFIATFKITPGGLEEASIELGGAAGMTWTFQVGTDVGVKANVNGLLQADPDFSIPVAQLTGVPLTVTVRQRFEIKTGLGVRNARLGATGDYKFNGSFKVGYFGGKWDVAGPLGFTAKQSMMQTAAGISIGASGLNMAHQMKVIAGLGAGGFAAGPYFSFTSAVGVFKGSDLGMVPCKEATLVVRLSGGVGYQIPKSVTDAINFLLRALRINHRIEGEGGLSTDPIGIINSSSALKGCKAGQSS